MTLKLNLKLVFWWKTTREMFERVNLTCTTSSSVHVVYEFTQIYGFRRWWNSRISFEACRQKKMVHLMRWFDLFCP